MEVSVEKQPKSTIKLIVKIPNAKVKETYEKALDFEVAQTTIDGFRKGMGPRETVRDKIGLDKIYGDVINELLKAYYPQALKENQIAAIANPKVEIKEFDINKDLEFTATVAIRPDVKIGDYRKALKDNYEKRLEESRKTNAEKVKTGEKIDEPHIHMGANEVIDVLLKTAELEVSDLLVEDETERMMARLLDQAQSIGLSMDQYLKAQNKTAEQLKKDYDAISVKNLKSEFVLGKLIIDNSIEVTDAEIEEMIKAAGIEDAQKRLEDPIEKFYVKSILQKNKLLTSLIEEIEGENHHEH